MSPREGEKEREGEQIGRSRRGEMRAAVDRRANIQERKVASERNGGTKGERDRERYRV